MLISIISHSTEIGKGYDIDEYPKLPIHEYGQVKQIILEIIIAQSKTRLVPWGQPCCFKDVISAERGSLRGTCRC